MSELEFSTSMSILPVENLRALDRGVETVMQTPCKGGGEGEGEGGE